MGNMRLQGNTAATNERIPRLGPGVDPTRLDLTPAEGYLLSRIDGTTSWTHLRAIGGIGPDEVDRCLERWLAAGVVVVEASRRSGSLITARLAADFGRDVFAVPGSVFSETSVGAHELLRDGAILCRGAGDVLAELFPSIGSPAAAPRVPGAAANLSPEAARVSATLEREEALSAEELAQELDLPAAAVLAALFELEGAGLVTTEGGRYSMLRR
jgi:DNA-binding transcriptional ArsR family regulator